MTVHFTLELSLVLTGRAHRGTARLSWPGWLNHQRRWHQS